LIFLAIEAVLSTTESNDAAGFGVSYPTSSNTAGAE
jgi:hypothetical protein